MVYALCPDLQSDCVGLQTLILNRPADRQDYVEDQV